MPAPARMASLRGAMHRGGGQTLQGSAKMRALAQLARQRGEKHRGGGQILRCGAAMRALARLARPRRRGGGQTLRCSATMHATSRLGRLRGARHCARRRAYEKILRLAMQHEDACTCKAGTTARCNAPWRWPNLAVQREDEAPARLARQRGVRHRGGGQTLRCSATIHATSRLARLRGTRHCACGNLVAQREDACTCKTSRTARCKVPCLRRILRCSTTMLAPVRLARLRGAMHRGGDQTL